MSNVRRRRSTGTQPRSSSECKCIWRSSQQFGVAASTANICSLRLASLLRAATEWKATAIAHLWPPGACGKKEPCGLPVPPAGGQRTNDCAWKAQKASNSLLGNAALRHTPRMNTNASGLVSRKAFASSRTLWSVFSQVFVARQGQSTPPLPTPNPSIEGTASGLRPPAATHVKR